MFFVARMALWCCCYPFLSKNAPGKAELKVIGGYLFGCNDAMELATCQSLGFNPVYMFLSS